MSLLNSLIIKEINSSTNPYSSSFVFSHLPLGMGTTIGNCLRQVLLTYLEGIAPLAVEITDKEGPKNCYLSTLVGAAETTPELVLNLKQIILAEKKKKEGIFCLELKVENKSQKERIIAADDFQKPENIAIQNPELYLATLAPDSSLEIKLYCQKNWGYHQAEEQSKYLNDKENIIILDSDYSPTKGGLVNFQVKTEVSNFNKEEEKLTLDITTNRSIEPKKSLLEALKILNNYFTVINKNLVNGKEKEELQVSK
jgi:DNA-directed RNA polymerase subunit alpha